MWFFKNYGILGQNARNLNYIYEYNNDAAKSLADSKLKTKDFLSKKGVKVAKTLIVLNKHKDLDFLDLDALELPFVVKPNAGYGGKGILVFEKKDNLGNFTTNDNEIFSKKELLNHISDILDGFYSLSGSRDKVIFEKKIILDTSIELLGKYGLPDIRVIVFNSVPVIAMLRVPTSNSKGKANLHVGACGVGIDISTGKLTYITQFRKQIKSIPGIGDIRGIELPKWDEVLKLAVKTSQITNIGYIGCDIVLDDSQGPTLLEMNVRPGLEVQLANLVPLAERLKKVQNIKVTSIEKGVRLGKDLFGGDIEEKIKSISGKKVLGNKEYVEIFYKDKKYKCIGEIKTNKSNNYINKDFLINTLKYDEKNIKNDIVKFKCNLLGEPRSIKFQVKDLERSNLIIGKETLYGFLIDPFKYKDTDLPIDTTPNIIKKNTVILKGYEEQLLKIDKDLMGVDKKLNILKFITPKNTGSERLKFIQSKGEYIPQLEYLDLKIDIETLYSFVSKVEIPDIPLSGIYLRKKEEILNKLSFLEAFRDEKYKEIISFSKKIYGDINIDFLEESRDIISKKQKIEKEQEYLTLGEIRDYIKKFNHIYDINLGVKERDIGSRFAMKGDVLYVKNSAMVGKREMRSIIAHEIEGHYLRKLNGSDSKYSIFGYGTSDYLPLEEGIAIYNQSRFLNKKDAKYYGLYERYYFINFALNNSYEDLLEEYKNYYNNNYEKIFSYLVRLKRGFHNVGNDGCFLKDVVYLNGYKEVVSFLSNGGDLKELYFGKISLKDLEEIKKSDFINLNPDEYKVPFFI